MDRENEFLKKYNILKWDEFTELNNDRISVNEKITNKVITKHELLSQFRVELSLLNACKHKIKDELEKTDDVIDTQILVSLCKRITYLFDHMHILFSIEVELLSCYINFCLDNTLCINAEQLDILLDAVSCTGDNQTIWIQLLKLHLKLNNLDKLMKVFHEGVRLLKNNSLPLWKILIRHLKRRRPDMVQTILEEGSIISYENISMEIRPKYLEWCIEFKGIDFTRTQFIKLILLKPACCKLYLTMIAIEYEESDIDVEIIRKLFDATCTLFGSDNIKVWIEYIRFEHIDGSQKLKRSIFNKALWKLETNLKDIFMDEYNNLEREFRSDLGNEVITIDD
ncbi:PREDICTED: U3 small nucleolar RNA-associated protein 6 homolog [Diuraphis noxia]|uniref:U3 small nucleolar RNA-associated protein 6 homolog n=1 Tax=Diuraphis noxia TaxID=143948 RepID=UPI00076385AC|nr:PREDICTED: U3 small nucleolar RNA-associated protein 6 homolog [Diuraphis noxia]